MEFMADVVSSFFIDYGCALQKDILLQGRIYVSEHHLSFHANIFGWITNVRLPFLSPGFM